MVEHGCQVQQAYGGGEDACADDSPGPTPLDCIQNENWGSSHHNEQANAVAYAVRDLLPQRLRALTWCNHVSHGSIPCAARNPTGARGLRPLSVFLVVPDNQASTTS